jgi:hypothetical protein
MCLKSKAKKDSKMLLHHIKTGRITISIFAGIFAVILHLSVAGFAIDGVSDFNSMLDCVVAGDLGEGCRK